MSDPWHLVSAGRYEDSIVAFSARLSAGPDAPSLRNRSTAFLMLGRYPEARADILAAKALDRPPKRRNDVHSVGDNLSLGVIDWLEGRFEAASQTWLAAVTLTSEGKVEYADASGGSDAGLLLAFAAARLSRPALWDPAIRLFSHIAAKGRPGSWPGPIALAYVGSISPSELLLRASTTPLLRERELCQAHFAIAVMALHAGNDAGFLASLALAAGQSSALVEHELHLARYELGARGA